MKLKKTRKIQKNSTLSKKIATYALTGVAVTTGGVNMAEAQICDSTTTVTLDATASNSVDVDIDGDGVLDFNLSVVDNSTSVSEAFLISGLGGNLVGPDAADATYLGNRQYLGVFSNSFAGTSALGSAALGVTYGPTTFGTFPNLAPNQGGLQFDIGGMTHFGAIFLDDLVPGQGGSMTLSFQWEKTPGVAFGAVIPEPSSLALLALGGVGLAARRRRKS